jgi:putative PIN family toxin of toxin-antitoxin system
MLAVLDTNVVVSGIFWKGAPHRCLLAFAKRQFQMAVTTEILEEYLETALEVKQRNTLVVNPTPILSWLESKAKIFEPVSLPPTSRDLDDDIFIGCAIGASAKYIVTFDHDLLDLEKPFGIEILKPEKFLKQI